MTKKSFDIAMEKIEKQMEEEAAAKKKMNPVLDRQLKLIQETDNHIKWYEGKAKELEKVKQSQLSKMGELLDLAMRQTHTLKNGFTVKPDNKRKIEVTSIKDFMVWLKKTKEPQDVMEFLETCMTITPLKKFCDKEVNEQRLNGEILPHIGGVEIGNITFRRLTTEIKRSKKSGRATGII